VFFDSDGGREALYAYIVAGVFRVFGSSVLTLRGTAAAVGVLGVIATYFAVRRWECSSAGATVRAGASPSSRAR
jgi:asparagine N-glycosylation enzyme membrane subunit Stt3